jgi:hypothetical protein
MITNDLQKRIFNGDREAFRSVYQKYGRGVYLDALKALGNETAARGVVKQTFLSLHNELMCRNEDIVIHERVRELAEHEILLRQVLGSESGEEAGAVVAARGGHAAEAPEKRGSESIFGQKALEDAPEDIEEDVPVPDDMPALERTHAYMRADGEKGLQDMRKRASDTSRPARGFGTVLLILFLLMLLWVLGGILMDLGILPSVNLGYRWFNENIFRLFTLGA